MHLGAVGLEMALAWTRWDHRVRERRQRGGRYRALGLAKCSGMGSSSQREDRRRTESGSQPRSQEKKAFRGKGKDQWCKDATEVR